MITSHAYLLFYRRRSDKALGGPKFDEILRRFEPAEEEDDQDDDADADADADTAINSEGSESR